MLRIELAILISHDMMYNNDSKILRLILWSCSCMYVIREFALQSNRFLHATPCFFNSTSLLLLIIMSTKSSTSSSSDNSAADSLCKYHNPYFGSGCKSGSRCEYKHLKAKDFIGFCTRTNKENKPNNSTRNTFRSAIDLLKKGKPQKAVKKFEKIIKSCPYDELYNMWFARCHEELENLEEAEFFYRRSISIQPKFATAHGRYAEFSWHKLRNIKQANVHFQKSLQNKENHVTHRHYAQFLEQEFSDYKKSQFHFERCLELSPNDHGAHHSYAIVLQKMNSDIHKIRYHYDQSIKLYDCANIHYSYALYLKNIKANQDALKHFRICLQYDVYNATYHFQCGLFLYQELKCIQDGLVHLNNACNLAPRDKLYKSTLAKMSGNTIQNVYKKRTESADNGRNNITANSSWGSVQKHDESTDNKCESPQKQSFLNAATTDNSLCDDFDEYFHMDGTHVDEVQNGVKGKHQCEIEFERFIKEKIALGPIGQVYVERFNKKQINDIRLLEFVDAAFLKTEIGMNVLHSRMMLKKIDEFKRDMTVFANWLKQLGLYDEYFGTFEMNGVITFDLFYHHAKNIQSIADMIGKQNLLDAMYLFHNTPKQSRQNALGESSKFVL
eukprot:865760_1